MRNDVVKISAGQFMILIIMYTIGTAILYLPAGVVRGAKQDAWLVIIAGCVLGAFLVMLFTSVGFLAPNKTFAEITEWLLGKWLGKLTSLAVAGFMFLNCAGLVYYLGSFITVQMMPATPIEAIHCLFIAIIIMTGYLGFEALARCAQILFAAFCFLFLILLIFSSPQIHFQNMLPFWDVDARSFFNTVIYFTAYTSLTYLTFLMMWPYVSFTKQQARKTLLGGMLLGNLFLLVMVLMCLLVLGVNQTEEQLSPSYTLAQNINVGHYVQRIEVVLASMWMFTLFIKSCMYFFATVISFAQFSGLQNKRAMVLPLGLLLLPFSILIYPNITYQQTWDTTTWIPFVLTFCLALPLLLLLLGLFRKYRTGQNG